MGYTTTFDGIFTLNERLYDSQALYLLEFSTSEAEGSRIANRSRSTSESTILESGRRYFE